MKGVAFSLAALAALSANPALAQNKVLTPAVMSDLCADGVVRPDRLAAAIVSVAAVPYALVDTANPLGASDGVLQLEPILDESEPLWILRHYSGAVGPNAPSPRPFGPKVDLASHPAAEAARLRVAELVATEVEPLIEPLNLGAPGVEDAPFFAEQMRGGNDRLYAADVFAPDPRVILRCRSQIQTSPTESPPPTRSSSWRWDLRLRGTVADLRRLPEEVADGKAASVGYDLDEVKDTEKLTFSGVAAAYFRSPSGSWNLAPFFAYERKDVRDNTDEIEALTPGLLVLWKPGDLPFVDAVGVEFAYTWDQQQSAELARLRLSYYPIMPIAGEPLFMKSFPVFNNRLWLRPELAIIGDAVSVRDAGSSPILATTDHYFGIGGDLSLSARLERVGWLSDFRATIGLRQLHLMGGIDIDGSERRYGSIEYNPKQKSWLGIALTFSEGDSDETLQREDTVALKLTLRR